MSQTTGPRPAPAYAPARRQQLGASFDGLADHYTAGRPTYPADFVHALLGPLLERTDASRTVLEVGSGTGQATGILPRFFSRVTSMEPGLRLSQEASRRYCDGDRVRVHRSTFEAWPATETYDCIFSASAFHWADPYVSYEKAAALLKPSGALAVVSYGDIVGEDAWEQPAERIREIYRRHAPHLTPPFGTRTFNGLSSGLKHYSGSLAQALEYFEFGTAGAVAELPVPHWFEPATVLVEHHERPYTGEGIVTALTSYGGFRNLDEDTARRLAAEICTYVEDECNNRLLRPFALVGLAADRRNTQP
ncbi:methyltransferase domain-containing protein [Streptomyces sp. NPDC051214]|uniref:class I SAM-dependent methyltransferase n=1 Tax=Streptomyces sp. NPDC051214 TaxID=3155282 RepID=UPI003418346C